MFLSRESGWGNEKLRWISASGGFPSSSMAGLSETFSFPSCLKVLFVHQAWSLIFKILDQYKFLGFCLKEEHWSIFFMKLRNLSNVYWLQSSPFSVLSSSYNLRRICVELCRVWSSSLIFNTSGGFWKNIFLYIKLKIEFLNHD